VNTSETADKLIIALVGSFDNHPAELNEPGFGLDGWDLAVQAKLISKEEAATRKQNFLNGNMDDLPSAFHLMVERGWAKTSNVGAYGKHSPALFPTVAGIDYAHKKMHLSLKKPLKWESTPQRAWKDTEHFRQSAGSFWLLEVVGAAIFGIAGAFGGYWLVPTNAASQQQFAYPTIGGGIGVIVGFIIAYGLIYLWNLFRAPYRQRDELRSKLSENQNLTPLSNRKELVTAIADAKIATIELIESEIYLKNNPNPKGLGRVMVTLDARNANSKLNTTLKRLDKEKLVAGTNYEKFISPLVILMQSGVASVKSDHTLLTFKAKLEESVIETIKNIDEISKSAASI
jgi:hypothetical protein